MITILKGDELNAEIEANPAGGFSIRYRDVETGNLLPTQHSVVDLIAAKRVARRSIGRVYVERCGSGWTNDRCTKPLGHRGDHSNE